MWMRDRIPVCPHGNSELISDVLIAALEKLEADMKLPLVFTSGFRCAGCNEKAGGVKNSAHMRGNAVDITVTTSGMRFWILENARRTHFKRIGIGKNMIHLDVDTTLPNHVIWLY